MGHRFLWRNKFMKIGIVDYIFKCEHFENIFKKGSYENLTIIYRDCEPPLGNLEVVCWDLLEREKCNCVFVVGDDLAAALSCYQKKKWLTQNKDKIFSILAGVGVESEHFFRFWHPVSAEICLWFENMLCNLNITSAKTYGVCYYNKEYPKKYSEAIKKGFSEYLSGSKCVTEQYWGDNTSDDDLPKIANQIVDEKKPDIIFVIGYGGDSDKGHAELIKRLAVANYEGYVVSNMALTREAEAKADFAGIIPDLTSKLPFQQNAVFVISSVTEDYFKAMTALSFNIAATAAKNGESLKKYLSSLSFFLSDNQVISVVEGKELSTPLRIKKISYIEKKEFSYELAYKPLIADHPDINDIVHYQDRSNSIISEIDPYHDIFNRFDPKHGKKLIGEITDRILKNQGDILFYFTNIDQIICSDNASPKYDGCEILPKNIFLQCKNLPHTIQINLKFEDINDNKTDRIILKRKDKNEQKTFSVFSRENGDIKQNNIELSLYGVTETQTINFDDSKDNFINFLNNQKEEYNFVYYIFPTSLTKKYQGCAVIVSKNKIPFYGLQTLRTTIDQYYSINFSVLYHRDNALSNTKSAIGSIMSRNGSHNIGSHVLAAMSHNIGTMPDDRVLYQYIQQRMDYVAQACTEMPAWMQPTMFVGDLMKNFFSQRHLLEHIAESEGLSAYRFQGRNMSEEQRRQQTARIKLFVRRYYDNSESDVSEFRKTYSDYSDRKEKYKDDRTHHSWAHMWGGKDQKNIWAKHLLEVEHREDGDYKIIDYAQHDGKRTIDFEHDIQLAIPGGAVGYHAFYTILENVIRNAAKHGWAARKGNVPENLEICMDFEECKDDPTVYRCIVRDNVSDVFASWRNEDGSWKHDEIARMIVNLSRHYDCWKKLEVMAKDSKNSQEINKFAGDELHLFKKRLATRLENEVKYVEAVLQNKIASMDGPFLSENIDAIQEFFKQALDVVNATNVADPDFDDSVKMECKRYKEFWEKYKIQDSQTPISNSVCGSFSSTNDLDGLLRKLIDSSYVYPLSAGLLERGKEMLKTKTEEKYLFPMHWQQQLFLCEPFIDAQTGNLRRENWGLAEMKISAGYLTHREIEEIGGLHDRAKFYVSAIICPVTQPGICRSKKNNNGGMRCPTDEPKSCEHQPPDCPVKNNKFHLGYRFHICKPRDILIVLTPDKAIETEEEKKTESTDEQVQRTVGAAGGSCSSDNEDLLANQKALREEGIYLAVQEDDGYYFVDDKTNKTGTKIELFNFNYVVLPELPKAMTVLTDVNSNDDLIKQLNDAKQITLSVREAFQTRIQEAGKESDENAKQNRFLAISEAIATAERAAFPFRLLIQEEQESIKNKDYAAITSGVFDGIKSAVATPDTISIKQQVYKAWLQYLNVDKNGITLAIKPDVKNDSTGGGQGLVKDADIFKFVFQECYHSTLTDFVKNNSVLDAGTSCAVKILALYPFGQENEWHLPSSSGVSKQEIKKQLKKILAWFTGAENGETVKTLVANAMQNNKFTAEETMYLYQAEVRGAEQELAKMAEILKSGQNKELETLICGFEKILNNDSLRQKIEEHIRGNIENRKDDIPAVVQSILEAFQSGQGLTSPPCTADSAFAKNVDTLLSARTIKPQPVLVLFDKLVEALLIAFQTSSTLLSKYEEDIATLPTEYKVPSPRNEDDEANDGFIDGNYTKELGILLDKDGVIKYRRHDTNTDGKTIYSEALSGSQSYLNMLIALKSKVNMRSKLNAGEFSFITRLAENGLLRILILDERVANFLKEHGDDMIKKYSAMRIWVANVGSNEGEYNPITEREISCTGLLPNPRRPGVLELNIEENLFDILIIHQGIIDKWWEDCKHDRNGIAHLLINLQKRVPRVVITTGRGRPDNIPAFAKVLPFSTIEASLFRNYPEKLTLTGAVMNILPTRDSSNTRED